MAENLADFTLSRMLKSSKCVFGVSSGRSFCSAGRFKIGLPAGLFKIFCETLPDAAALPTDFAWALDFA